MSVGQFIFTDCERGKGLDPNCSGYQVAACSDGLMPEWRQLLSNICLHYGEVVYRHAPRQAQDAEAAWRSSAATLDAVPESILDQFPVVWSYDCLQDDMYALTGVKYCGLTHDKRVGNFLAHSLIFAPEALAGYANNPLSARNSAPYFTYQPGAGTKLSTLPDLGSPPQESSRCESITAAPFCEHLAALVAALATATPHKRPLVVCVENWREAAAMLEELLMLLPPSSRRRTTVSTFEGDRAWLPTTREGRGTAVAAHHCLVLVGTDGRGFNLRPDEYQSVYSVFNFVENRFSDLSEIGPYAAFAAKSVQEGAQRRLAELQQFMERLDSGGDLSSWDKLTSAAQLRQDAVPAGALTDAVDAIADVVITGEQAQVAFDWVMPHIERLSNNNQYSALNGLVSPVAKMCDLLPDGNGVGDLPDFRRRMADLSAQAYSSGYTRTAEAVLRACGGSRDQVLLQMTLGNGADVTLPKPTDPADRELLVKLLRDVLENIESDADRKGREDVILVAVFEAAADAGVSSQVWAELSDGVVHRLDGSAREELQHLAQQLLKHLSAEDCPDAVALITIRRLEAACPAGDELTTALAQAGGAAARCEDAEKLIDRLLAIARKEVPRGPALAVTLGTMAETAFGAPAEALLLEAYDDAIKSAADQRDQIRNTLADKGAVSVLIRELTGDVLPWDRDKSKKRFKRWWDKVLSRHPEAVDACCGRIADWLQADGNRQQFIPLAEAFLAEKQVRQQTGGGVRKLFNGLILALPVSPLPERQQRIFSPPPDGLNPEARHRLRLLNLLRDVDSQVPESDWTITTLPCESENWKQCVRDLTPDGRKQLLRWCFDKLAATGISTPQEAEAMVRVLKSFGHSSDADIVESFCQLLDGRDAVTDVVVGTAIARCHLEQRGQDIAWRNVVKGVADRYDKHTRTLFEEHLLRRFCRPTPAYQRRLRELCELLGLRNVELPGEERGEGDLQSGEQQQRKPAEKRSFFDRLIGRR